MKNKIQAEMQVNVSFLGKTDQLVKELQGLTKNLNLDSSLYKPMSTALRKSVEDMGDSMSKLFSGLSKKGLSTKQYTDTFNSLITKVEQSIAVFDNLGKSFADAFNSPENKEGLKLIDKYVKKIKELRAAMPTEKATATRRQTAISKIEESFGIDFANSEDVLERISKKIKSHRDLSKKDTGWLTSFGITDKEQLKQLLDWYDQVIDKEKKLEELHKKSGGKSYEQAIANLEQQIVGLQDKTISPDMAKSNAAWITSIDNLVGALRTEVSVVKNELDPVLKESEQEAMANAKAQNTLREVFAQFGIHFSAAAIVKGFTDLVKSSFEFYKSLDSALNEIYVVSSLSSQKVNELQGSFLNMAKTTGMALDDITRAAVLFYQQGLNTAEVQEMTRVTAQFAKVAGIDATDAADKLTAAVNGYRLSAEDAMSVADKFNKVAAASAADINELSTAFSKAAAQANQAGVSMDNYLAYIATMEEATREAPENLGTSLKTIFSRMQQIKTGENTEEGTTVNDVEKALRTVNIALRDTSGQLRDLEEIFAELGPKWNTLDRNTQAYLGTIIAGTRQQSRFITLMQNWDRVLDLASQSENSAGQQALMHAKAMDSITSKLQQLNVAWQEFISNLASSSLFKGVISGLTKVVNLLNSGTKPMSLLATTITAIAPKLKEFQGPLLKSLGNFFGIGNKTSDDQLNRLKQRRDIVQRQHDTIENNMNKERYQTEEEINQKLLERLDLEEKEEMLTARINKIEAERAKSWGDTLKTAGIALNTIGIAVGEMDSNLGGIISSTGTITNFIGQIATGNWIGAITTGVTAFLQIKDLIDNWDKRIEERVNNAIQDVAESLQKVNNLTTQINSTNKLIERYNVLIRTIYRTEQEQEELNKIIQELGDTYNIDVLADGYGNLSINIEEVEEELSKLTKEQEEAYKLLQETERESLLKGTSGLGNHTSYEEYLRKNLENNRSDYKTLLTGLTQPLINAAGEDGKKVAQAFSSNLKTAIRQQVNLNPLDYVTEQPSTAMLRMQNNINTAFANNESALQDLYKEIDFLDKNVNNMTYAEAQEHLQRYWDKWHDSLNLTQDEWNALVKSINTTTFNNGNIINFIEQSGNLQAQAKAEYWTEKINKTEKELREFQETLDSMGNGSGVSNYAQILMVESPAMKAIMNKEQNEAKEAVRDNIKILKETLKEYYAKRDEFLKKYAEEHNLYDKNNNPATEEASLEIEATSHLAKILSNLNVEQMPFFNNLKSLFDFSDMTGFDKLYFANFFDTISEEFVKQGASTDADRYNIMSIIYEQNKDRFSEDLQHKIEAVIEQAENNLQVPTPKSLKQIGESLKSWSADLIEMNEIISDFNKNGGLDLDSFIKVAGIIDKIDFSAIGELDPGAIDAYVKAIDNLNLAFNENTGAIDMNAVSLNTLQDIQEIQVKSKINSLKQELQASAATVKAELDYIDAQIAATEAASEALNVSADVEVTVDDVKKAAGNEFTAKFTDNTEQRINDMKTEITNQKKWATASIKNVAAVGKAYGELYKGIADKSTTTLETLEKNVRELVASENLGWEGVENESGLDLDKYGNGNLSPAQREELSKKLDSYLDKLRNSRKLTQATLSGLESSIKFLDKLGKADLSKLGIKDKDKESLKDYIGKLKEIYNILNRIQVLEHRLSTLDTYSKIAEEKEYGDYLHERIGLNEELLRQYDFLVREQKAWTNGYRDFIKESAVADVFSFDKYGQIIIDFEKYNKLSTTATKNTKSLKEQADELYETYTSMFEELQKDFDQYIKYLQVLIDLHQEVVDAYVNTEHDLANAIKEIYQQILKDRLEAIDKEKEAIEDLRKARERARDDQQNAKELSGLQVNLQRAMMDTSGASDSNFIKAQQDINDKLDKIADDKYSQMLDDIKQALDEEKDALQNEFDEMFDDLHWLFEWLEANIMSDENGVVALLQETQAWRQQTEAEHMQEEDKWRTRFQTYSQLITGEEGKTVTDVVKTIDALQRKTVELDEALKNEVSKRGAEVQTAIQNGLAGVQSAVNSVKSAVKNSGSYYTPSPSSPSPNNPNPAKGADVQSPTVQHPYRGAITKDGDTTPVGTTIEMDKGVTYTLYKDMKGSGAETYKSPSLYEKDIDLLSGPTWSDQVGAYLVKINLPGKGIRYVKASRDLYGQGDDTWFHATGGFQGSSKKYATGGLADYTGPAWLDGSPQKPEYVLSPLQTEHFLKLTNLLDRAYGNGTMANGLGNNISIDNISFNVASMSSPEDGERAFNMFVQKFREIGSQTGIQMNNFKNTI